MRPWFLTGLVSGSVTARPAGAGFVPIPGSLDWQTCNDLYAVAVELRGHFVAVVLVR